MDTPENYFFEKNQYIYLCAKAHKCTKKTEQKTVDENHR